MTNRVKGKIALVTGAASRPGIGYSCAERLAKEGATVYLTDINKEGLDEAVKKINLAGGNAIGVIHDVASEGDWDTVFNQIKKDHGRIDILINNAGVGITGPMEEINADAIASNFATNCFGPLQMAQAVIPKMRDQSSGTIITLTSIASYMGLPFRGPYSASKSALSIMSESLRMEVKEFGIKVLTLAPGDYATDIASRRYHSPVINKSPYKKYKESLEEINKHVDKGNSPEEVAKAIAEILTIKNPRVHYQVGSFLQKLSKTLKNILPSRIFEKVIMNHYKL